MKLKELFEMPIYSDDKYIPADIKTDATPSLQGLKRNNQYLGRITFGTGEIYDFWLNNERSQAKITVPNESLAHTDSDDINGHSNDSRHTIVTVLDFQPAPSEIPEKNKLQVKLVSTHDKHQDRFLAGALYILLIRYGYSIVSDFLQFQGGKGLWKSIAKRAEELKYVVRIWDEKTEDWIKDQGSQPLHYTTANLDDASIWHDINTHYGQQTTLFVLSKT